MNYKVKTNLISFNKLIVLLLAFSVVIQLIIITYNHLTAYYIVSSLQEFLVRLSYGSIMMSFASLIISLPDLYLISKLNEKYTWQENLIKRALIEFIGAIIIASLTAVIITNLSHLIDAYEENFKRVLINNILIAAVINILLISVLEARIFFIDSKKANKEKEKLQNELAQIKFEVLKNQINPHFLFNSLNVLSALIDEDKEKAQEFLDEFSHIYRYVLETIDKSVVSVKEELNFAESYIFLQKMRYGKNLNFEVKLNSEFLNYYLPPLSLQLVLENAIKHNIISKEKELKIELTNDFECIVIKNNIQAKTSKYKSTSLGQKNLVKRYSLISSLKPEFYIKSTKYIAKLPIIKISL